MNPKLKAFTLTELLVTLALTAILVALAYGGLNYMQRLLMRYNEQSGFITRYTELQKRLQYQVDQAREIRQEQEGRLLFISDSAQVSLQVAPGCLWIDHQGQTDTFRVEHSDLQLQFEPDGSQLVRRLAFDLDFRKQKFPCIFIKKYDAFSKLGVTLRDVQP